MSNHKKELLEKLAHALGSTDIEASKAILEFLEAEVESMKHKAETLYEQIKDDSAMYERICQGLAKFTIERSMGKLSHDKEKWVKLAEVNTALLVPIIASNNSRLNENILEIELFSRGIDQIKQLLSQC